MSSPGHAPTVGTANKLWHLSEEEVDELFDAAERGRRQSGEADDETEALAERQSDAPDSVREPHGEALDERGGA